MNKMILREALKSGFAIKGNSIVYNTVHVDLNKFLVEINKLQFTHSVHDSICLCTNSLFLKSSKSD